MEKTNCIICGQLFDYEPKFCCHNPIDCECGGLPIDPPVCSDECYDYLMNDNTNREWRE